VSETVRRSRRTSRHGWQSSSIPTWNRSAMCLHVPNARAHRRHGGIRQGRRLSGRRTCLSGALEARHAPQFRARWRLVKKLCVLHMRLAGTLANTRSEADRSASLRWFVAARACSPCDFSTDFLAHFAPIVCTHDLKGFRTDASGYQKCKRCVDVHMRVLVHAIVGDLASKLTCGGLAPIALLPS
jgi:hypothetical protein